MFTTPKISIITPSFNQRTYIGEALESVKHQAYPFVEHIVVDGASTDGTVEVLREYTSKPGWQHLRWTSEKDRGQSDALNKGFKLATGDLIGWLNSDDRYRPSCFATIVTALLKYPQADVLYGDYTWIDETGRVWQIRREIEFSHFILSYHKVLYIPTTSSFFRRRIFQDGNWIDDSLNYAMDYEFFLRLAHKGYRFQHVPALLADFRWHQLSKSSAQSTKQLQEYDAIAVTYSQLLEGVPGRALKALTLSGLRCVAAGLRYSQKLIRGYYFHQFPTAAAAIKSWAARG